MKLPKNRQTGYTANIEEYLFNQLHDILFKNNKSMKEITYYQPELKEFINAILDDSLFYAKIGDNQYLEVEIGYDHLDGVDYSIENSILEYTDDSRENFNKIQDLVSILTKENMWKVEDKHGDVRDFYYPAIELYLLKKEIK